MRLFVAVCPPVSALRELAAVVTSLRDIPGAEALRWTPDQGHHLTLTFLGEVDSDILPELERRLAGAAGRHDPLALRIDGGGRFTHHVLWAGIAGDTESLARLADSTTAAARRTGIGTEEGRIFRPHLTLARARPRRPTDLRPYVAVLVDFTGTEWTAERIELVNSLPPESGVPGAPRRYETVASWPLGG